jgi:hypothetical protein
MKNDRLSSLGLMHINQDFEVDVYKAMEVFVSAKKFLSIKDIKIELDSILYETLKWSQIAPFCIVKKKKKNPRPPLPLKNYGVDRELDLQNQVWYKVLLGKSLRLVMTQWVRHLATSLLKSSDK